MKIIKANNKEYKLEFSYEAAECKELVQKMFNVRSGAYLVSESDNLEKDPSVLDMLKGTVSMISDIPSICRIGFYAGLLENNQVTEEESKDIMKSFMKENNISYRKLYDELNKCMEDDGFFDLSGITEAVTEIFGEQEEQKPKKTTKTPQDHKKSTGTK